MDFRKINLVQNNTKCNLAQKMEQYNFRSYHKSTILYNNSERYNLVQNNEKNNFVQNNTKYDLEQMFLTYDKFEQKSKVQVRTIIYKIK